MTTDITDLQHALEDELQRLRRRITLIEALLSDEAGDGVPTRVETPSITQPAPQPDKPKLSVPLSRLNMIRKMLEAKGEVRQVELTNALKENSGNVSVALRVLEQEGAAEKIGVDRKSNVWRYIGEPTPKTPKNGTGTRIDLGTAGHTTAGDRDAKRIAENLRYTTEEPQ